jgi:hypothetical protein
VYREKKRREARQKEQIERKTKRKHDPFKQITPPEVFSFSSFANRKRQP